MRSLFRFLFFFGAALWIGGGVMISVSAPIAFEPGRMPTKDMAGSLVGALIAAYHWMAHGAGLLMAAGTVVPAQLQGWDRRARLQLALVLLALTVSLGSGFGVSRRMSSIRAEVGSIENSPKDHPLVKEFDRLHHLSVTLLGFHLMLVTGALGVATYSMREDKS